MMTVVNGVYDSFEMAFFNMLRNLMEHGEEVAPRGFKTKEQCPANFIITRPQHRRMLLKGRDGNPFATIAETLWMMSGRNNLDWLERYIPQCKKWSDDGKTWRAGYGPRLRRWGQGMYFAGGGEYNDQPVDIIYSGTDQIQKVIDLLKRDPDTRQAVITLWNPGEDWVESKDIPCNNWLHFIIRGGKLHLNTAIRSNDIWFGFSHCDFFGWSYLQQLIAHLVGVEVGAISWNATSFHIYESKYRDAGYVIRNAPDAIQFELEPLVFSLDDLDHHDDLIDALFEEEKHNWRKGDFFSNNFPRTVDVISTYWQMLFMYNFYLEKIKPDTALYFSEERVANVRYLANMVSDMEHTEAKYMAIEYFSRTVPGFSGALHIDGDEYKLLHAYHII